MDGTRGELLIGLRLGYRRAYTFPEAPRTPPSVHSLFGASAFKAPVR
jgi:hypothetical protein